MTKFFVTSGLILFISTSFAFGWKDSLDVNHPEFGYNTKRAAILSAILPGAGQIYNEIGYRNFSNKKHRAWWKVPLIYGGLGACGYFFYHNNKFANLTRQEYLYQIDNPNSYLDARFKNYPKDANGIAETSLIQGYTLGEVEFRGYDSYANKRDLFLFAFIGVWGLNVIEAYVDAHFVTFDVSEDLSMSWHPTILAGNNPGIRLAFDFN
ncbi:DUF5683 domain-containing protein [Crocinitomix algicola]|uniref:DUF5683 domain-containing protein n=1 Tax=Crocinitomix algicola TaxID=1740263 RepID=UPI00087322CD|nr:DUF5683 domain-containing protein [Crocinitomix algicola]